MTAQDLKEQILRSEGYAEGFKNGYTACAMYVASKLEKQEKNGVEPNKTDSPVYQS